MFGLGFSELIIIAVIILLIFGARRLPEIGKGLGKTVREVRKVSKDLKDGDKGKEPSEGEQSEDPKGEGSAKSTSLKSEIESIPGAKEIRTVKQTASQVRKWWGVLKH
jgi:sec-independent protein translocase protein TatA